MCIAVVTVIETLPGDVRPVIQRDHGRGVVAGEFALTPAGSGAGQSLIRVQTPTTTD